MMFSHSCFVDSFACDIVLRIIGADYEPRGHDLQVDV